MKPTPPFVPGHESVGIVVELGPGVIEVALGDRVSMPWLGYACGVCDHCVSGWETLCLERKHMGYSIDGGSASTPPRTPAMSSRCPRASIPSTRRR